MTLGRPVITSKINVGDPALAAVPKAKKLGVNTQRVKYSNFLLTVNTNQPIQPASAEYEPYVRRFKGVLNRVLGGENILRYLTYKEAGGSPDKIFSINCETTIEAGGARNPSVHAHSVVQIKHHTLLHLDQMKMRHVIQRAMATPGKVHLNVRSLPRNARVDLESALRYIRKDVRKEAVDEAPADNPEEDNVAGSDDEVVAAEYV